MPQRKEAQRPYPLDSPEVGGGASHLARKGVSIYKVSQWLGHQSVNTTMVYAHPVPQDDEINKL